MACDSLDPLSNFHTKINGEILLCPPHLLVAKKFPFEEMLLQEPCSLHLRASLSPISSPSDEKPTLSCGLMFLDNTEVILPSQFGTDRYLFPCPFSEDNRLSIYQLRMESSHFVRSLFPRNVTIEHRHHDYFESEMTRFIGHMIKKTGDKFHVDVYITASIKGRIWHEDTVEAARKIEEESRLNEREGGARRAATCRDCAVCFEEIEMSRFQGAELDCYHAFHVSCIAPWLAENNTCPMCRHVQLVTVSVEEEDVSRFCF